MSTPNKPQIVNKYKLMKKDFTELIKQHKQKAQDFPSWNNEFLKRAEDLKAAIERRDLPDWIITLQKRVADLHGRMVKTLTQRLKLENIHKELTKTRILIKNRRIQMPDGEKLYLPPFDTKKFPIPKLPSQVSRAVADRYNIMTPSPIKPRSRKIQIDDDVERQSSQSRNVTPAIVVDPPSPKKMHKDTQERQPSGSFKIFNTTRSTSPGGEKNVTQSPTPRRSINTSRSSTPKKYPNSSHLSPSLETSRSQQNKLDKSSPGANKISRFSHSLMQMIEDQQTVEKNLKDAQMEFTSLITALAVLAKERNEIQDKLEENEEDSQLKSQLKNVNERIESCKRRMSEKSHDISLATAKLDSLEDDMEDYTIDVSFDPDFSSAFSRQNSPAPAIPEQSLQSPSEANEMLEIQNLAEEVVPIAEHDFMLSALELGQIAQEKKEISASLAQNPNDSALLKKLKEVEERTKRKRAQMIQKSKIAAEARNDLEWINEEVVVYFGDTKVVLNTDSSESTIHARDSLVVSREHRWRDSSPSASQNESFTGQTFDRRASPTQARSFSEQKSVNTNAVLPQPRSFPGRRGDYSASPKPLPYQRRIPPQTTPTPPHRPLNTRRRLTYSASPNASPAPPQQAGIPLNRRLTYNSSQSDGSSLMKSKSIVKSIDEMEDDLAKAREDVLRLRNECNVLEEAFDEIRKTKQDYKRQTVEILDEIERNYVRQEALVKSKKIMLRKAEKEYSRINELLDFYWSESAGWETIEGAVESSTTSESSVQLSNAAGKSPAIVISPATFEGLEFSLSTSSDATSDRDSQQSSFFDHEVSLSNNQSTNEANIREVRRWRNLQNSFSPADISENSISFSNIHSSTPARLGREFTASGNFYSVDWEGYYEDTSTQYDAFGSWQDMQTLKEEKMQVAKRRRDTPARVKRQTFDPDMLKTWRTKFDESSIKLLPAEEVPAQVQSFLEQLIAAHNVCNYWQDVVHDPDAEDQSESVLLEKAATYREAIENYNKIVREGENFLNYIMENPNNYTPEVLVYVRHVLNVLGLPSPAIDRPTYAPELPFNVQMEE